MKTKRLILNSLVLFFFFISFLILFLTETPQVWLSLWFVLNLIGLIIYLQFGQASKRQLKEPNASKTDTQLYPLAEFVFNHLDHYVMVINTEGFVMNVTEPWKQLFQERLKVGSSVNGLMVAPSLWSAINQSIATEKSSQIEWEFNKRNFKTKVTPLFYTGEFFGVMITALDITKATQIEKIQSDFLADISHEIKTPLAAIMGAAEILNQSERKLNAKEAKEFQAIITSESVRLQKLIHELTDLSKIGTLGFQTLVKTSFSIKNLVEEVMKIYHQDLQRKKLLFKMNVHDKQTIFADYDKFFSIFSNLISNAIRYTEQGMISVSTSVHNQVITIAVSDTGLGIEPQNLERIFDRFYRTEKARTRHQGGTGLGLAITRAIIQAHQGTIQVVSELNKGTTFTITLPQPTAT